MFKNIKYSENTGLVLLTVIRKDGGVFMENTIKKESMWRDENGKFYYGWVVVIITSILCMFSYCGIVSVAGLFTLAVSDALDVSIGQFTMHQTILSVVSMIALAVCTRFFTQKHLKKTVVVSMIIGCIGFGGFAMAHSLSQIYIFAIAFGISFGLATMTPSQILVSNWFGEKYRAKAMSIWLSIITIGPAAMVPVINAIILGPGWRMAYAVLGIGLAICIPLVLIFVKFSPEEKGIKRVGDVTDGSDMAVKDAGGMKGIMFKDAIKKPWTWLVLLSITFFTIGSGAILSHGVATVVIAGYSQTFAANLLSGSLLIMVILCLVAGIIIDKIGMFASVLGAGICFIACYVGLAFMTYMPGVGMVLYFVGYLIGVMHVNLISPLLLTHVFGDKDIGSFLGWHNILLSLGVAFGPGLVGILFDATGAYMIPWIIMGILTVIGVVIRCIAAKQKTYTDEEA